MGAFRTLILAVLVALVAAGCGDDDAPTDAATDDVAEDTDSGAATDADEETGEAPSGTDDADGADDAADGEDSSDGVGDAVATATVSDGSTWEFTEIVECEIGEDGSPDFRQFIGQTADGSARLDVAYFPEAALASLSGVGVDAEVDGSDWTYASSYAGSEGEFDVSLRSDGADGTASVRVVGIGAPDADLTLDWSFTC